jgi:hypothetical protein
MFRKIIEFCFDRPKIVVSAVFLLVIISALQFFRIKVDTDPENMLPDKEPVRVFHNNTKEEFGLYDYIVLGIVNEKADEGVFDPETLKKVHDLTERIKDIDGVIAHELISPATKDDIEQAGIGTVRFRWLMGDPPYSREDAGRIRERAMANPMFYGTIISENGKALSIYVPIREKDMSYRISDRIREMIDGLEGDENYYITGLPVAQDTFGFEMFKQMAISAPLAMLVIFLLMLAFFKKIKLVLSPLILAGVSVVLTMGALIGGGFTVHIMSSMIPIFIMPIAVLDSVHILSEFFEKYRSFGDRKSALMATVDDLFMPMLFTSLTTTAGFGSLAFARIPPVQVFGVFVAIGVMIAWFLTMTFIPAGIALMGESSFRNFGAKGHHAGKGAINTVLRFCSRTSYRHWKTVIVLTIIVTGLSIYGISKIRINDNPVKWFTPGHRIRVADRVLNEHFGGTYTAYFVMEAGDKEGEVFKEPVMLRYVEDLQRYVERKGDVGKTTALTDVVKKVYYELLGGDKKNNVIPDSKQAVAQTLISFQNSHNPDDLWHFTVPDYSKITLWFQLRSGDNKDMTKVVEQVKGFLAENPPPFEIKTDWAGLTYINVVWQDRMVTGMLRNFAGSFVIVLFMMIFLFRSPVRGLVSMIPLTVTIVFIYSLIGYTGKYYDMPVAVLSALTLGLSVDFAIHFLQRAREIFAEKGSWEATAEEMFAEPGRAIMRNALIISIGFLPLLAAPLVPYKTVGVFMFLIMITSSIATLLILPAIISAVPKLIFYEHEGAVVCKCSYCMLTALIVSLSIVYVLAGYTEVRWSFITISAVLGIVVIAGICNYVSKHKICIMNKREKEREVKK